MRHLYQLHHYQGLANIVEEKAKRMEDLWDRGECCAMLCSGHDVTISIMSSHLLWLPAHDLCKIKPVKNYRTEGIEALQTPY